MNKNEKYSIRKYDKIADNYETTFDGRFTAKFKTKIIELCEVKDGMKILDVGCGNGSLINGISKKGNIQAYGIDISSKMIEICKKQYENINFSVSTGEIIPFEDKNFDMLIICCVLHHLNNPQNFFIEAKRVLKNDGILIVGEPCFPLIARKLTDWIISPLLRAGDNKLFSHKRLKNYFINNSFSITEIYKKEYMQIIKGVKNGERLEG